MIPVRCFSCGKPIGHLWNDFKDQSKNTDKGKVLDKLGMERFCCRQVFLTHVELIDVASKFKKN